MSVPLELLELDELEELGEDELLDDELGKDGIDDDEDDELGLDGIDDEDEDEEGELGIEGGDGIEDGEELGIEGMEEELLELCWVDSQPASSKPRVMAVARALSEGKGLLILRILHGCIGATQQVNSG